MKLAGRIGFRKVVAGLFVLYIFMTYLFFGSSNPISVVEKINHYYPNIDTYLTQTTPAFLQYLPNQWVAEFLYNVARGAVMEALPHAVILFAVTMIAFGTCLVVAYRFYYKSWLVSLQVQSAALAPYDLARKHILDFRSRSLFSSQIEVLVKKEFFAFFRDASQWIHLVVMIILAGLFSVSVSNLNLHLRVLDMQLLTYLVIFAFGGFMISSLALRFVFPMIGMEGRAFWVVRSSPVGDVKVLLVKFVLGFILVFILAEYIAISSNIPFFKMTEMRPLLLWFGIFSAFWISLATVSFDLGLGGYFANYLERNPIRAASSQGATLTFLATLFYLFILVVIVLIPISAYFTTLFRYQYFKTELIVLPGTLFAVISYLLSAFGLSIGLRSMRRDF
jgi:ABC-2 type transport system permease protein